MSREAHVRFWESAGVRIPCATHLPLYRQERMHARAGVTLPRSTLARWLVRCEGVLQPIYNLIQDAFFAYDIALSDDTTIQVLKEDGRSPSSKSALWIRRGGPPDSPVVLVDYRVSKSAATASGLLGGFRGYLVSDAAPNFHRAVAENALVAVLCNDHARRRFTEIVKTLPKKEKTRGWTATKAIGFYRRLYAIERELGEANARPEARLARRQAEAVPIWNEFIGWAREVADGGVRHAPSAKALKYLLENETGLRRHCEDGATVGKGKNRTLRPADAHEIRHLRSLHADRTTRQSSPVQGTCQLAQVWTNGSGNRLF